MQNMIDDPIAEKAEETKLKEECGENLLREGKDTTASHREKDDLETSVFDLEIQKTPCPRYRWTTSFLVVPIARESPSTLMIVQ